MDLRALVVEEARSWVGTPFVHEQRVKGVGIDCATILAEVYERSGGPHIVLPHYDIQWNQHVDGEPYLEALMLHCVEVLFKDVHHAQIDPRKGYPLAWWDRISTPLPGDVGLWKFGRCWAHCTIVIEWPLVLNPMMHGKVELEYAQTIGSCSTYAGRMRLLRPRMFL